MADYTEFSEEGIKQKRRKDWLQHIKLPEDMDEQVDRANAERLLDFEMPEPPGRRRQAEEVDVEKEAKRRALDEMMRDRENPSMLAHKRDKKAGEGLAKGAMEGMMSKNSTYRLANDKGLQEKYKSAKADLESSHTQPRAYPPRHPSIKEAIQRFMELPPEEQESQRDELDYLMELYRDGSPEVRDEPARRANRIKEIEEEQARERIKDRAVFGSR